MDLEDDSSWDWEQGKQRVLSAVRDLITLVDLKALFKGLAAAQQLINLCMELVSALGEQQQTLHCLCCYASPVVGVNYCTSSTHLIHMNSILAAARTATCFRCQSRSCCICCRHCRASKHPILQSKSQTGQRAAMCWFGVLRSTSSQSSLRRLSWRWCGSTSTCHSWLH